MQLLYNIFYKQFGIRRLQQFFSPIIGSPTQLALPRNATYHFATHDPNIIGFDITSPLFSGYTKRIPVKYVTEFTTEGFGAPRKLNTPPVTLYRPILIKHRQLQILHGDSSIVKDPLSLVVFDYSLLNALYRYVPLPMTEYYRWKNIEQTVWDTVRREARTSNRQQFVPVTVPPNLPAFTLLKTYATRINPTLLKVFPSPERLMLLELWKWFNLDYRDQSLLAGTTRDEIDKINLILTYDGYWSIINLGVIENWLEGGLPPTDPEMSKSGLHLEGLQVQKLFFKSLLSLQSKNLSPAEEIPIVTEPEPMAPVTDELPFAEIDEDLKVLEHIEKQSLEKPDQKEIKRTESGTVDYQTLFSPEPEEVQQIQTELHTDTPYYESIKATLDTQASHGVLSANDYRQAIGLLNKTRQLKDPYGTRQTLLEACVVKPEEIVIPEASTQLAPSPTVVDKSMLTSSLLAFDQHYLKNILHKDVMGSVASIQKAGIVIQDYRIEEDHSPLGHYEYHTVQIKPIDGQSSVLHFRLPKISDDNDFQANGNKYILRKQRSDVPIRKISPHEVGLTSYYGKLFVRRSEKRAYSTQEWLTKILLKEGLVEGGKVTQLAPANVFVPDFKAPKIYTSLAMRFKAFKYRDYYFTFDSRERSQLFPIETLASLEGNRYRVCGITDQQDPILVDYQNVFYTFSHDQYTPIGDIYQILGLDIQQAPVDYAEMKVFSKSIPLVLILGYLMGFSKLIKLLGLKYRAVDPKQRVTLERDEYAISFKDCKLILSRTDLAGSLIFGGLIEYKHALRYYTLESFDHPHVYLNILETKGIRASVLREISLLDVMFIDPITKDILVSMNEPITFKGLLLRANELLLTDRHPVSQDMRFMRVKGYERFAGAVYRELISAIRTYKATNIRGKSQISLNPYAVWQTITHDQSIKTVEDINPITDLREQESVTYAGIGGRSKDAMARAARSYHPTDMGIISEATTDSGDVAVNTYMTANPKLKNIRGIIDTTAALAPANLLSTSALAAPAAVNDSVARTNFLSIQNCHTIACDGYHQSYVRTGYEQVIPQRTGSMFAITAKQPGTVKSLSSQGLVVTYEDGRTQGYAIGRQFGKAEGSVYPHDIVTPLEVGDQFAKGDPLIYNTGFFEPDILNPKQIVWKSSVAVPTALLESSQTHEDGSALSERASRLLNTRTTKIRSFVVAFNQNVHGLVSVDLAVKPDDVLLIIEDAITVQTGIFTEDTAQALKRLAEHAPKAKVYGKIDRIEMLYNGDKNDMSETLRAIADRSDKELAARAKASGNKVYTGQVSDEYNVRGNPLVLDTAEIKIYITVETRAGTGDKGVFASQMKSVFGEIMHYPVKTESGEEVDAIFGYRSIQARTVLSPDIIGTTTTLLKVLGRQAVSKYKS